MLYKAKNKERFPQWHFRTLHSHLYTGDYDCRARYTGVVSPTRYITGHFRDPFKAERFPDGSAARFCARWHSPVKSPRVKTLPLPRRNTVRLQVRRQRSHAGIPRERRVSSSPILYDGEHCHGRVAPIRRTWLFATRTPRASIAADGQHGVRRFLRAARIGLFPEWIVSL